MPQCKKCKKSLNKDNLIEYTCHSFCHQCLKSNIKKGKAACPICEEEIEINFFHDVLDDEIFKKYFFGCKSCESYHFLEYSIDLSCDHMICKACLKKIAFDKLPENPRKINCIRKNCQENIKNDIEKYYKMCLNCEEVKRAKKIIYLSCSHSFCQNCLSSTWNKRLKNGKEIKCLYEGCKEIQNKQDYDFLELLEGKDEKKNKIEEKPAKEQKVENENDDKKKQPIDFLVQSIINEYSEIKNLPAENIYSTMDNLNQKSFELIDKKTSCEVETKINLKKDRNDDEEADFSKFPFGIGTSIILPEVKSKNEEEEFKIIDLDDENLTLKNRKTCIFCKKNFIIDDLLILDCEIHTSCKDCLDDNDKCNNCQLCSICSNYLPPVNFLTLSCKHSFCKHCLLTGWELLINEAQATQSSMKCLECSKPLEYFFLKEHLSKELFEKYDELINLEVILSMDNKDEKPVYCPLPTCSKLLLVDARSNFVSCTFCSTKFCIDCKLLWEYHQGKKCEEVKQRNQLIKEDEELLKNSRFQKCPHCKYLIEKTNYCNYVRCASPVCKKKFCFCFLCGSLLDENNLKTHYLDENQYQGCKYQKEMKKLPMPIQKNQSAEIKYKCNLCKKENVAKEILRNCENCKTKNHKTGTCMTCKEMLIFSRIEKHICGEKSIFAAKKK